MAKEKPVERRDLAAEANKKIGILARIGQVWFAICLVTALLATWLFVTLTTIRFSFWDGLNPSGIVVRYCTRFAILMFHATLWIAVKLNPQIQVKCEGFDKWEQLIADPARPICILANHLSFMDMICGCARVGISLCISKQTSAASFQRMIQKKRSHINEWTIRWRILSIWSCSLRVQWTEATSPNCNRFVMGHSERWWVTMPLFGASPFKEQRNVGLSTRGMAIILEILEVCLALSRWDCFH